MINSQTLYVKNYVIIEALVWTITLELLNYVVLIYIY